MAELSVELKANVDQLLAGLDKAKDALTKVGDHALKMSEKLKKVGEKMSKIGKSMSTYLTLPLLALGGASIKMASDFEESLNKVDVAFKSSSQQVRDFAKTTLESFGIAEGTSLDMAALFGDMATGMGLPVDKAANLSTSLVGLAGDLSSFKNVGIKEVTTALNGVFTGETESLKMLGIVMTEANLQQFALSKGMSRNIKVMTQAEKVQLRYAYILENTKNAQGDFARTSDGSANQMRIFSESVKELTVAFGEILLPYFTKAITYVNQVVKAFTELSPTTKKIIVVIAALVAVIGPLLIGLGFLSTTIIPALITGFGILLGPIGLIIAAVVALGVIVYKNFDAIIAKIADFYNSFVDVYNQSVLLRGAIAYIVLGFKNMWVTAKFAAQAIWAYLKMAGSNIIGLFKNVGKVIAGALTLDLDMLKEGILGVKDTINNSFNRLTKEVSKLAKDAGGEIADNFNQAIDSTVNGHLEHKTAEDLKKGLSSLGDSLKETAKEVGKSVGLSFSEGVSTGTENGGIKKAKALSRFKAVGLAKVQIKSKPKKKHRISMFQFDEAAANLKVKLLQLNEDANNIITGSIASTFSNLGSVIGDALSSGGNVLSAVGATILQGLGSFLSNMGKMLIEYGTLAVIKGKLDLAILAGGPLAIVAGLAAIGVGVALSAAGSAIGNFSAGGSGGGKGVSFRGSSSNETKGSNNKGGNFGASSGGGFQNVVFQIEGTKLIGVISNTLRQNRALGGSLGII